MSVSQSRGVLLPLKVVECDAEGKTIKVIRDDILEAGTKERGQDFFNHIDLSHTGIVATAAPTGYGQIAIAKMAAQADLHSYIVVARSLFRSRSQVIKELTKRAQDWKGQYIQVNRYNDLLHYYDPIDSCKISIPTGYPGEPKEEYVSSGLLDKVAVDFCDRHQNIYHLGLGLEDPKYIDELIRAISKANTDHIYPDRLWCAVGSGTLLQAFHQIWPNTHFMCVQVGRDIKKVIDKIDGIKATIFISEIPFIQSVHDHLPPFPSLRNYDAKAWKFILEHGQDGDYFWNVAGNL